MTSPGQPPSPPDHTVVVGAGPAGLTAAYLLTLQGRPVTVVEKDDIVGGIARTAEYKGYRFDIGGHRFFTKVTFVNELWRRLLGPDMLRRPRLSRIFYDGRFFDYPLKPMNALTGLGLVEAFLVLLSYLRVQLRPIRPEVSLEDWVSNRFGRRLYNIFFKTYTEKVWGIPCHTISAEWAAQRIKGLSLWTAVTSMLFGRFTKAGKIKTLIDEFEYPRLGPGMMWEKFRDEIEARGGRVLMNTEARGLMHHDGRVTGVEVIGPDGGETIAASGVLSTMPLRQLVAALSPAAPPPVREAASRLKYRDFLTVVLILDQPEAFPDNWIYVHDAQVKLGRVQNFKNWSPEMVPDPGKTCLGLEYFCNVGDELWNLSDRELTELGRKEMAAIGLIDPTKVVDATVVRMPKAYPVYDEGYQEALDVVREYLVGFANLQVAGRNGMHKYNNQDHSMVTALLAVQNLLGERRDVWAVNADDEYHEEIDLGDGDLLGDLGDLREMIKSQPQVPRPIAPPPPSDGS